MADVDYPPATQGIDDPEPDDCFKILVATDNHIGYAERDPVRGKDSINTFEEILQLAVENDVDFLLLAGDLFHENKPSRASLYQTTALLRQYCLGRRPVSFALVSDAGMGLGRTYDIPLINYEDENLNIGLPVFSIHGNHDDPQGAGSEGALAALDILAASGLINYFGRQELPGAASDDVAAREQGIQVKPLLMQKGSTKLAMYGIGNMRDERFYAEMRKNRISLYKPTEHADEWFNLLLIHQNRAAHTPKSSVPEDGFGDDVDLIIWGHEHDCRVVPEDVGGKNYRISQPGSSIATSLAEGESKTKHVAILKVQDRSYSVQPVPLRTVRPFIIAAVDLNEAQEDGADLSSRVLVTKFLKAKVNEMIAQADAEWAEVHKDDEEEMPRMLPLIRLKVLYEGSFETGNPQRFGQEFANRVANPRDVVSFTRRRRAESKQKVAIDEPDLDGMDVDGVPVNSQGQPKVTMEDLVHEYLQAQSLEVIAENGMARAVYDFVEKDDTTAIKDFIKAQLEDRRGTLVSDKKPKDGGGDDADEQSEDELAQQIALSKAANVERIEKDGYKKAGKASKGKGRAAAANDSDDSFGHMSEDEPPAKSKGKGKAAASNGKGKGKELFNDDSDDDDDAASVVSVASSSRGGARKAAAPKKAPAAKKAPAKKTAASAKQSQLAFAPARGKAGGRAAASKATKQMAVDIDSDDDDGDDANGFVVSDSDDEPPKKKATRKR